MQKILVTGTNGLLGQKLVYALLARTDVTLIATSRGENRLINKNGYTYQSLDISNADEVNAAIEKHAPQTIINTAAMTNVDACETQRDACRAANVTAVKNLVAAAEKMKAHLIHLSTDFIFDGMKGAEYIETDAPNPLSYYALSKAEAEKIVQQAKTKWSIARTIILYGVADNMSRSNIVLWAKGALENGQKINVVDDQFRSPTLAEDLAQGCLLIADKKAEGIYHLSGAETMSVLNLVYRVADFWNLDKTLITPVKSNTLNQPAKRPPRTGFIITKAQTQLGYMPHTFEQGLAIVKKQLRD
jgi:dTDP-4-dehydrorhamnose reductase